MKIYFKIRSLQVFRLLKELGIFRLLFLCGALGLGFLFLLDFFTENPTIVALFSIGVVLLIHLKRGDYFFIISNFRNSIVIFFVEYLLLSLPILLIMLYHFNMVVIAYILGVFIIACIRLFNRRFLTGNFFSMKYSLVKFIPVYLFEWISGLRKYPFIVIPYVMGIALATKPYFTALSMWFILVLIASFYAENEPLELLLKDEVNASKFIRKKLWRHGVAFAIVLLPLTIFGIAFNSETIYITLYAFGTCMLSFFSVIIFKYATYSPAKNSFEFIIISNLSLLSVIVFPLWGVVIPLVIFNTYRMKNKLNHYLYAYN